MNENYTLRPWYDNPNNARINRVFAFMLVVVMMLAMMAVPAMAAGEEAIVDAIKGGTGRVFDVIKAVAVPFAAIYIAIMGLKILLGDKDGINGARKGVLVAIAGLAIVIAAPMIADMVSGWFSTLGDGVNVFG